MQKCYHYLAASLPYLFFKGAVPVSVNSFLEECGKWLSKKELSIIVSANLNNSEIYKDSPQAVNEWKEFNNYLSEELALARKEKDYSSLSINSKKIFESANPLEMEKEYEKLRWDFIDQLEPCYYADINWLVLYKYKLQILERLRRFNKEQGHKIFNKLCEVEIKG